MSLNDPILPDAIDVNIAGVTKGEVIDSLGLQDGAFRDVGPDSDELAAGDHTHPDLATNAALTSETSARMAGDLALDTAKAPVAHTHAQVDVTGLAAALSGKADSTHTHAQSDITGLSASLAGKSDTSHSHSTATTSVAGFISAVNQLKLDNLKFVQTARAQTDVSGNYTWTYPTAFGAGVVPRILAIVESASGVTDVINIQVNGAPTNTQCVFKVNRTSPTNVALLGLTILSTPASVGAQWIHMAAHTP